MYLIDPDSVRELARMRRKLDGVSAGPGITLVNTGDSIVIGTRPPSRPTAASFPRRLWVRITGNEREGSYWRWTYTGKIVVKTSTAFDGWTDATDEPELTKVRSTLEVMNPTSGLCGNGVDTTHLPSGFKVQPIPTGAILPMDVFFVDGQDEPEYWVTYSNGIDGTCT